MIRFADTPDGSNDPFFMKSAEEDYYGTGESYVDGKGCRRKGKRPKIEEIDKKEGLLKFLEEPENKITIIKKGDVEFMKNLDEEISEYIGEKCEPEFYELEKNLSETNRKALIEAVSILNKYKEEIKKNPELRKSLLTLARFLGFGAGYPAPYPYGKYPTPTKKDLEKSEPKIFNWKSFFDFDEEDLEEEDIEKSVDPNDPFPSVTKGLLTKNRERQKAQEEREISLGRRFI